MILPRPTRFAIGAISARCAVVTRAIEARPLGTALAAVTVEARLVVATAAEARAFAALAVAAKFTLRRPVAAAVFIVATRWTFAAVATRRTILEIATRRTILARAFETRTFRTALAASLAPLAIEARLVVAATVETRPVVEARALTPFTALAARCTVVAIEIAARRTLAALGPVARLEVLTEAPAFPTRAFLAIAPEAAAGLAARLATERPLAALSTLSTILAPAFAARAEAFSFPKAFTLAEALGPTTRTRTTLFTPAGAATSARASAPRTGPAGASAGRLAA
jgi:hypothetical protein